MNQIPSADTNSDSCENTRVTQAAGVVGSATLLSRILGYVRDMIMAALVGTGLASDAFIAAFRLPNLLRRLFGEGSLSLAFVPVFTDYLKHHSRAEANQLAYSAMRLLTLVLIIVAFAGVILAPWLVRLVAYGFTEIPDKFDLCVNLTRIMFPYIIFIGLVALCMGILNVLGHFAAPALAPVFLNMAMIGALLSVSWTSPSKTMLVTALAVGVLCGGGLQLGIQVPFLIQKKVYFWRSAGFWHPGLKRVLVLMGPAVFGAAVYQINIMVGTLLASLLPEGSVSYLYYADRLVQFPLGIFAIATATAVLPSLARQAAAEQWHDLRDTFTHAMKLVFFITLPSMVGLIVLRQPIISLLFQRLAFDAVSTESTASALLYYGMGLWAFSAVRIVLNTFYALKDTRTPVRMAMISIFANIIIGIILMRPMQHNGLALATSLASVVNLGLLTFALRKRLGALGWRRMIFSIAKSAFCALLMGIGIWALAGIMIPAQDMGWWRLLMGLTVCIGAGIAVYGTLGYLFRVDELYTILRIFLKRK